jgi:predicted PurR-regulated permease PerM
VVEERVIRLKARTVFAVLGILIGTFVVLDLLWQARSVLTWIVIALFLTLALNPLVERLQSRGIRRGMAVAITMLGLIGLIAAIGAAFVPMPCRPTSRT